MRVLILTSDGRVFDEVTDNMKDALEFIEFTSEHTEILTITFIRRR